jgi:hypothetical protein
LEKVYELPWQSSSLDFWNQKRLVKLSPEVIIDESRIFHPKDEDVLPDDDGVEEDECVGLDDRPDQANEEANILEHFHVRLFVITL